MNLATAFSESYQTEVSSYRSSYR